MPEKRTRADVARENGQRGGRPKGRKNNATLAREEVLKAWRERVAKQADPLFEAQLSIAKGCSFLFRKGVGGKYVLIKNPDVIRQFLDGELDPDQHYYIHTERPNNFAISDMLDRTFGKAPAAMQITGPEGGPLQIHHHFSASA